MSDFIAFGDPDTRESLSSGRSFDYNNTIYLTPTADSSIAAIKIIGVGAGNKFRNNILQTTGGAQLVSTNTNYATASVLFQGNDWYAGDDNSTANWQNCAGSTFRAVNPGLCAAQVDFASTMTHELGHALVFYHPQTLDQIDNIPVNQADSASAQAKCVEASGEFPPQATMCSGQGQWRAEQRTLETWDVETMHRAYDQ